MDLLTQIGITQAELQEKLIERLASEILAEDTKYASVFDSQIEKRLKEYMDARIAKAFEQHVRPMVNERIDNLKYHIDAAVKTALGEVNSSVRKGLEGAVKLALANVKVVVDTKVTT